MISTKLEQSLNLIHAILGNPQLLSKTDQVIKLICRALASNNRVYFCGTGSTCAIAENLSASMSNKIYIDRPALPVITCHPNVAQISPSNNQQDFTNRYSRHIQAHAQKGDVLIILSGNGNSTMLLNATKTANEIGMITIALSDEDGGKIGSIAQYLITAPATDPFEMIQFYMLIGQIICIEVEQNLFEHS